MENPDSCNKIETPAETDAEVALLLTQWREIETRIGLMESGTEQEVPATAADFSPEEPWETVCALAADHPQAPRSLKAVGEVYGYGQIVWVLQQIHTRTGVLQEMFRANRPSSDGILSRYQYPSMIGAAPVGGIREATRIMLNKAAATGAHDLPTGEVEVIGPYPAI